MKQKINVYSELAFLFADAILSLGVAMLAAADLGVSMTGAPAYLLSLKFPFMTFGMWELAVQLVLIFMIFVIIRKVQLRIFLCMASGSVYAVFLDLWRAVIPWLNPQVTTPDMLSLVERGILFCVGMLLVIGAVALFFHCYIYPQSYDLFVREVCRQYGFDKAKVKTAYDLSFLVISFSMTLLFFGEIRGIGWGSVLMALVGGSILGVFDRLICRYFEFRPLFPKLVPIFQD